MGENKEKSVNRERIVPIERERIAKSQSVQNTKEESSGERLFPIERMFMNFSEDKKESINKIKTIDCPAYSINSDKEKN